MNEFFLMARELSCNGGYQFSSLNRDFFKTLAIFHNKDLSDFCDPHIFALSDCRVNPKRLVLVA